ncbi:hypothetical protein KAI30_00575 [Candidatus Bathyarchaeota archaeon]|nr:hypothetical protein [Candidatus Bathyarchaeota archaeon]
MSQKTMKIHRRIGQKEFDKSARKAIFLHIERLATQPLHVRLAYAWRFVRGRNPHTNKKVSK